MLLGCGCHCLEDSVSSAGSRPASSVNSSLLFPSQSQWPNSTDYPDGYGTPCLACIGGVRATSYKVDLGNMTQQQPTIFGDWGCVEMLQTPFRVWDNKWNGTISILKINEYNCAYGTDEPSGNVAPPVPGEVDCSAVYAGQFKPNAPGIYLPCGPWPVCDLLLTTRTTPPPQSITSYEILLRLTFRGSGECSPVFIPPLVHYLSVDYASSVQVEKFACLNEIALTWKTAFGNHERQNPDGPGFESYGIGPGNNRSYEFHRGTFPEQITIRPWGT